jgi:hypothetical protein
MANSLRVNAELDVRHERLTENRVETKEQLPAHYFKLLLPRRIGDCHHQRFTIETKGNSASAQGLARDAPPRRHRRRFSDLFRFSRRPQEFREHSNKIIHPLMLSALPKTVCDFAYSNYNQHSKTPKTS